MATIARREPKRSALAVALALSGLLPADIVRLKNGNSVEGEVSPGSSPETVKVVIDRGVEVEFPQKDILEIEKKKSPAREFEERLREAPAGDVDALLLLADWARERKLRSKEEEVYRRVLELDPNDPVARRELGWAVFKNRWVKADELQKKHGLIQFRGDWVAPEEREQRILSELKQEVSDLLRGADSENRYIREYSIRKLLEYKDPRVRAVLLPFLGDPREAVRVVAVQALASLSPDPGGGASAGAAGKGSGKAARAEGGKARGKAAAKGVEPPAGSSGEEVGRCLHERLLAEESPTVRTALSNALQRMRSRRLFELALETLASSANPLHRDRAAEGIHAVLRKAWVPEVIHVLPKRPPGVGPTVGGNPQALALLRQVFRQDFGYNAAEWEAWWTRNQERYTDDD